MANKKKGQKRKKEAVKDDGDDTEVVFTKKAKLECVNNENEKSDGEQNEEQNKPRRSPNGYILADPLPEDLIITDLRKQKWKIGKSVGLGGFGEIYSAAFLNGNTF